MGIAIIAASIYYFVRFSSICIVALSILYILLRKKFLYHPFYISLLSTFVHYVLYILYLFIIGDEVKINDWNVGLEFFIFSFILGLLPIIIVYFIIVYIVKRFSNI